MMANPDRGALCAPTSKKLAHAAVAKIETLIGLDGFVDEIIQVVDKRHSLEQYDRIQTIDQFARRAAQAAGQSANFELVVTQEKLGGNGPIMANALAAIGLRVTYIGNLGYPDIHRVFQPMTTRARVISIAPPGHTDALEFLDGKLMLGKLGPIAEITWENILERIGKDQLMAMVRSARLIGTVNWTMLPFMNDIWKHLMRDILAHIPPAERVLFVDLADPEKRTRADLRGALEILEQFQKYLHVILGLNLKEAVQVAAAVGLPEFREPESQIEAMAAAIRAKLQLGTIVIHPRGGAAAADQDGSAQFAGPFVTQPKISTGAGDHFNAGFVTGRLLGFSLAESLCVGTATSGFYVRTAKSPTLTDLTEFVRTLPPPQ
jgi:sugar/nucleoside kinase (ribokinase family)